MVVWYFCLEKLAVFRVSQCPCTRDFTVAFYQSLSLSHLQLLTLVQLGISHIQHQARKNDFLGLHAWLHLKYSHISLTVWEPLLIR